MENSKVAVKYHDPARVFPLISRQLAAHLPLRNLNWQSLSRHLRQIKSLDLDFVPANGNERRENGDDKRRHQIPGLQTSPYLKVYLLRCDDKDQYKDTEKELLKKWVKEVTEKTESHNACEWMILHVVIPDTKSASEPRWSSKETDEPKERPKSSAKWPGKSSRTVFDRLRADFNEKGGDRIAQLRPPKSEVPSEFLPALAVSTTLEETSSERENAWNDLISKLKALILVPFDTRVRQYETDIATQDARRSMPGWNFCTFSVHKEGLARALESIGLVEDALAVYDELNVGLETVIRDMASGEAEGTATSFAEHTQDFEARVVKGKSIGLSDQEYRERIVMSTISVFDFFGYLFSRQKALLLRLATEGGQNLVLLGEICWRASNHFHNNARALKQELPASDQYLVACWLYLAAGQVLRDTASPVLNGRPESMSSQLSLHRSMPSVSKPLPGQVELASHRSELIIMQRKALEALHKNGVKLPQEVFPALESISSFQVEYEQLSLDAMQSYAIATRTKASEAILCDLAMLRWAQEDYPGAAEYFQKAVASSPFQVEMHTLYAKCLQKMDRKDEYAKAVLDLVARALTGSIPFTSELTDMLEQVLSSSVVSEIKRPMDQFFGEIRMDRDVIHHEEWSGSSLRLHFEHLLEENITVDKFAARLVSVEDPNQEIIFRRDVPLAVKNGTVEVELDTHVITLGAYQVDKIWIHSGPVHFVHELNPAPEIPTLILGDAEIHAESTSDASRRPWTFLFPARDDFEVRFDLSKEVDVTKKPALEIEFQAGRFDVGQIDVKLRPYASGLRLHTADVELSQIERRIQGQLALSSLDAHQTATMRIPYSFETQHGGETVSVKLEATCTTSKGDFTFLGWTRLLPNLPLTVDVDDSFHVDAVFSNFSIRSALSMPLVVTETKLRETAAYHVETPPITSLPSMLVDKQPLHVIHKTIRTSKDLTKKDESLALRIQYHAVEEVVLKSLQNEFVKDLQACPYGRFQRLLVPNLSLKTKESTTASALAKAELLGRFQVPSFEDMRWSDLVPDEELIAWLREWHGRNQTMKISPDSIVQRYMTVAVDPPRPDLVHNVRLSLSSAHETLTLGEAAEARLTIRSTTAWSGKSLEGVELLVDIHAEPDTWLVGGIKRARIPFSQEVQTLDMTLVPLRLGLHSLPIIDVQPASSSSGVSQGHAGLTWETHCESAGQVQRVARDSRRTRVHIAEPHAPTAPTTPTVMISTGP